MSYFRQAISFIKKADDDDILCEIYVGVASLFRKTVQFDSCLHYARLAYVTAKNGGFTKRMYDAARFLSQYYEENKNTDSAFVYLRVTMTTRDSLFSQEKIKRIFTISFEQKQREQEIEAARKDYINRLRMYILVAGFAAVLLAGVFLLRNNRAKQKANKLLLKQKHEIEDQRDQTNKVLADLQQTQKQLIQSEKMASLGELTAGIAHEIQNPLNFVNNFSDVNTELILEMKQEIDKGNIDEAKAIANASR